MLGLFMTSISINSMQSETSIVPTFNCTFIQSREQRNKNVLQKNVKLLIDWWDRNYWSKKNFGLV